jgi:hypothetical protein
MAVVQVIRRTDGHVIDSLPSVGPAEFVDVPVEAFEFCEKVCVWEIAVDYSN